MNKVTPMYDDTLPEVKKRNYGFSIKVKLIFATDLRNTRLKVSLRKFCKFR